MISVSEAKERMIAVLQPGLGEWASLHSLAGRVLFEDLRSPLDLPPFRQSSMDGYAIAVEPGRYVWTVVGETRAGDPPAPPLSAGQARRIFTGAAVPSGADTVVRQEVAVLAASEVSFTGEADQAGRFVRESGSAVRAGEIILTRGTTLGAGAISFLASCGLNGATVFRHPAVSILSSGDELVRPGSSLSPGKIYESNSYALTAAVQATGIQRVRVRYLPDREEAILAAIREELEHADLLLLSGGISVGDYDFSGRALRAAGVEEVFYQVAQKPGMPLFFGLRDGVPVFGLPGNPASSLVCFWEYARTTLRVMMGYPEPWLKEMKMPIAHDLRKNAPRAAFERALVQEGSVRSLEGQDSYQLRSLAQANALLVLPEGTVSYAAGDQVTVHLLE